jgi:hypothetical protein
MRKGAVKRLSVWLLVVFVAVLPVYGGTPCRTCVPMDSGAKRAAAVRGVGSVVADSGPDLASGPAGAVQEKPDLMVLDTWTVPGNFCPQATVDLHSTIHNSGPVAVVDSFYFDMWFDGDNIGYARIEGLGSGASLELVLEDFVWPADSDSHVVTAMADTDDEIDEEIEVNNIHLEYFIADVCTACTEVSIPFDTGWNWFSLNVSQSDMALDSVLASLDANGVYIKNQTSFADYVPAWGGWFGTLGEINCRETYMIRMDYPDTLVACGFPYDASTPLELPAGWSWISYMPRSAMPLDDALASLGDNGEYIKDQTAFADYVPDWNGWFGTLSEMQPLHGYKIKMTSADILVYPDSAGALSRMPGELLAAGPAGPGTCEWSVNPHEYEKNTCLIAAVRLEGQACVGPGDRLAAFCGGECRGAVSALLNPEGAYRFYLTVYGGAGGRDVMTFRYWDSRSGVVRVMTEEMVFEPDLFLGTSIRPVILNACPGQTARESGDFRLVSLVNRPDPFAERTAITFHIVSPGAVTVEIYNIRGEKVATLLSGRLDPDTYTITWDGTNDLRRPAPSGVYFCRLAAGDKVLTDKVVLMR